MYKGRRKDSTPLIMEGSAELWRNVVSPVFLAAYPLQAFLQIIRIHKVKLKTHCGGVRELGKSLSAWLHFIRSHGMRTFSLMDRF
jgi:hypothetical protein